MEPSSNLPPDKGAGGTQKHLHNPHPAPHHPPLPALNQSSAAHQQTLLLHQQQRPSYPSTSSSASSGISSAASHSSGQAGIEKLCRPAAFDKMESLVREMQDIECGVPVRSQKLFLTSIPSAFMGYDLIEWLMERLGIEESEALNIANQLCLHGYFFPVNDGKNLVVKDDSSLYRFQTPYFWPWQHKAPDNVEYAIYLTKRSLRNKQRHGLEEYETDAMTSLHKNLKGKWDIITMQAEEQVKLCKERKKGDKIVSDSQEKAYWRVHRPPPGQFTPLEPCPVPTRDRKPRKRTVEDYQKEVDFLTKSTAMTRVKMSQACELLIQYFEVFTEYDPLMQPALPSNPWVSEDTTFWALNSAIVEMPTEKRVKRWSISIEELVSDPTGLQEFTNYLKKEYSHENIRFWTTVNDLRRSAQSQIAKKVREIYEEFLEPGAPCEINIDGKTMEKVQSGLKSPTRFTFDAAADHIYALLLKKDCYPRFIRSEHYKLLLASGIQPAHKKRFFGFGGAAKKKASSATPPNAALMAQQSTASNSGQPGGLGRRRGSDRSLTGSAHELAVSGVKDASTKVQHSHSQSNLCDIPYRESVKTLADTLEVHSESSSASCSVCPWDTMPAPATSTAIGGAKSKPVEAPVAVSICPWEEDIKSPPPPRIPIYLEKASDIGEVSERMKRSCGLRQSTLDSDFHSTKNLMPDITTQRRASITITPRISEYHAMGSQSAHGSSTSGIFTPPLNTLPIHESGGQQQSSSHQSMDSAPSVDDSSSVRNTPVAMLDSRQGETSGGDRQSVAQQISCVQIQVQDESMLASGCVDEDCGGGADDSADMEAAPHHHPVNDDVMEECCDCDEAQTLISTNSSNNNGKIIITSNDDGLENAATGGTSSCCCDPFDRVATTTTVVEDNEPESDTVVTVLYERINEEDNNNNTVIASELRSDEEGDGGGGGAANRVNPDNQRVATEDPLTGVQEGSGSGRATTPSIKISASEQQREGTLKGAPQLKREASIEGDEFMIQSRTASMEQKSESPVVVPPQGACSSSSGTGGDGGEAEEACESCKAEQLAQESSSSATELQHRKPMNQSQRQSTDVQSSDLEFEDGAADDGSRFLLRGCVAPAPTPAPSIAPLAEVEQDPQDEEFDEEDDVGSSSDLKRVICDKLKQQIGQPAAGLEKQQSNESDASAKTPPPELLGTLSDATKKDMVEPIPIYACSSEAPPQPTKKRRKKRDSEGKATAAAVDETQKAGEGVDGGEGGGAGTEEVASGAEPKGNPVCPWEDEDVSSSVDVPFVKTYATLGYL